MAYRFFADLVVFLHGCFVLFVLLGGILVFWKPKLAWVHIPAVLWGAGIEFLGWVCPLTPLEIRLRAMGGSAGYGTGFVEHYIMPILYPEALTREAQIGLGIVVLGINIGIYWSVWHELRKQHSGKDA